MITAVLAAESLDIDKRRWVITWSYPSSRARRVGRQSGSQSTPEEYDQIEYGGLPVKYAVFIMMNRIVEEFFFADLRVCEQRFGSRFSGRYSLSSSLTTTSSFAPPYGTRCRLDASARRPPPKPGPRRAVLDAVDLALLHGCVPGVYRWRFDPTASAPA